MRILEMLLKHVDSLELLLTIVALFLLPRVHPRLVLGEMQLSDEALITQITFEVLPGVEVEVGGEVGEHVHLHPGPAEPPAHLAALDWVEVVPGRILEFFLLVPRPRGSDARFGDQMSDKAPLGGECAGAVCTNDPRHPPALTETASERGRELEVKLPDHNVTLVNSRQVFAFQLFNFYNLLFVSSEEYYLRLLEI